MSRYSNIILYLSAGIILAFLISFLWNQTSNTQEFSPALKTVTGTKNASTSSKVNTSAQMSTSTDKTEKRVSEDIQITDGKKHTVPLDEIQTQLSRDSIPSIDNPKFVSTERADEWLDEEEPGIALSFKGSDRFYPYKILVWHEIVNDTIEGQRVLVTYCPLCMTGFVFDPLVKGQRVEFGTSGKLWKANLVMY
ncbi:MAG: DUF3179 domain-containing (seleno)protein, partial [Candidatus Magasanikbacteria bacterium]